MRGAIGRQVNAIPPFKQSIFPSPSPEATTLKRVNSDSSTDPEIDASPSQVTEDLVPRFPSQAPLSVVVTSPFIPGDPLSDPSCVTFEAMSGIFEGYEREYCELSTGISRKTQALATLARAEKPPKVQEVEADMSEADALVRRMDLEARSLPVTVKTPLLVKLREYKADLTRLKREAKQAQQASDPDSDRMELLSRAELGDAYCSSASIQRTQLLSATERVRATGDRIQQGKQTLLETEELGVSILQDLHRQRETIVNARDNLHEADDHVGRARRVLSVMSRRAMTNKFILAGVIAMLLAAIGVVIYFKTSH